MNHLFYGFFFIYICGATKILLMGKRIFFFVIPCRFYPFSIIDILPLLYSFPAFMSYRQSAKGNFRS